MELIYKSSSPDDTRRLGRKLGEKLQGGEIILLQGELGAGKTVLAQAICKGLDVEEQVSSPSFTLVNQYQGRVKVYHLDLYRLTREEELMDIGFEDIIYGNGTVLIEWPELGYAFIPPEYLLIKLSRGKEEKARKITLYPAGRDYQVLVEELKADAGFGN